MYQAMSNMTYMQGAPRSTDEPALDRAAPGTARAPDFKTTRGDHYDGPGTGGRERRADAARRSTLREDTEQLSEHELDELLRPARRD